MSNSTISRAVATLGVTAGLLAAAGPASAAGAPHGPVRADALGTQVGSEGVKATANAAEPAKNNVVVLIGANDYGLTEGNGQPLPDDGEDTQASLGRENSIECLVHAEVSDAAMSERP